MNTIHPMREKMLLQKNQITNEGLKILEKAAKYRQKGFRDEDTGEEYVECWKEFCKATGDIDTDIGNFKVYVRKYGVGKNSFTKNELDIKEYRERILGGYYANR